MSAYVVSKATMDGLLTAMSEAKDWLADVKGLEGYDLDSEADLTRLGQALFRINTQAVNSRYGERNKAPEYTYKRRPVTDIQAVKLAGHLSYQCTEGNVPNLKLYRTLQEVQRVLALRYAYNSPEYSEAKWGL